MLGFRGDGALPLLSDLEKLLVARVSRGWGTAIVVGFGEAIGGEHATGISPPWWSGPSPCLAYAPTGGQEGRIWPGEGQDAIRASMGVRVAYAWDRHRGGGRRRLARGLHPCVPPLLPRHRAPWSTGRERRHRPDLGGRGENMTQAEGGVGLGCGCDRETLFIYRRW